MRKAQSRHFNLNENGHIRLDSSTDEKEEPEKEDFASKEESQSKMQMNAEVKDELQTQNSISESVK